MPVTRELTTLGTLKVGDRVNLEPPLRVGDELGGHFVMGHVDGQGSIKNILRAKSRSTSVIAIKIPKALTRYIVPRGAIAIDGISLTVVARRGNVFTVSLVDYTLRHTTLGQKKVGDKVNIEIDSLARYVLSIP